MVVKSATPRTFDKKSTTNANSHTDIFRHFFFFISKAEFQLVTSPTFSAAGFVTPNDSAVMRKKRKKSVTHC